MFWGDCYVQAMYNPKMVKRTTEFPSDFLYNLALEKSYEAFRKKVDVESKTIDFVFITTPITMYLTVVNTLSTGVAFLAGKLQCVRTIAQPEGRSPDWIYEYEEEVDGGGLTCEVTLPFDSVDMNGSFPYIFEFTIESFPKQTISFTYEAASITVNNVISI